MHFPQNAFIASQFVMFIEKCLLMAMQTQKLMPMFAKFAQNNLQLLLIGMSLK
jgi:hypothetical protein